VAHQVHHSSEDYNLTTALRQSILQTYTSMVFAWLRRFVERNVRLYSQNKHWNRTVTFSSFRIV